MKEGSVLVDVAIDQGGYFETSRPTTHRDPTYIMDNVIHYCIANMPGSVPLTSSHALNNAILADTHLVVGQNVYRGMVMHAEVAKSLSFNYMNPEKVLASA
jgi:alanine dehydrogenase